MTLNVNFTTVIDKKVIIIIIIINPFAFIGR